MEDARAKSAPAGRFEKRLSLSVPLEYLRLRTAAGPERSDTENVSTKGARILTKQALESGEHLEVRFVELNLRANARVVYCQQMPDGRFGVGVHLEKMIGAWPQALKEAARGM